MDNLKVYSQLDFINDVSDVIIGDKNKNQDNDKLLIEKFKLFFDYSPTAMYVTSRDGKFLEINSSMCNLFGFSDEEFKERSVMSIYISAMDRVRFKHEVEFNGKVQDHKVKLLKKNLTSVECFVDAVAWRDDEGEFGGYIGIIKPSNGTIIKKITDDKYSLAIRGGNDGLWEWNIKQEKVHYTSRWKSILGYDENEIGDNINEWFSRIHPDDLEGVKQKLKKYINKKTSFFSSYYRMRQKNSQYIWMMSRGIAEFDKDGKPKKIAGSLSNISSHINLIEQFKRKENELSELNNQLSSEKKILSRYFSEDIIKQIMNKNEQPLKSRENHAVILYLGIFNSTGIIEKIGPEQYAKFANEFVTDVMDLVYGNNGSVNRIEGDTLLITFGCPISNEGDVSSCLNCALEFREYLKTFNDVRPSYLEDPLKIGMGISYGKVFSGSIGSVRRLDYAIIGKAVNKSRLLLSLTKQTSHEIIIDSTVATHSEMKNKLMLRKLLSFSQNFQDDIYSLVDIRGR